MDGRRVAGNGIGFHFNERRKSPDPKVFNDSDVYSTTRITIAPLLIVAGLVIEIFAIMKKPKESWALISYK